MAFGLERIITAMNELDLNHKLHVAPNKILLVDNLSMQKDVVECASILRQKFDVSILYGIEDYDIAYEYARHGYFKLIMKVKSEKNVELSLLSTMNSSLYATEVMDVLSDNGYIAEF